MGFCNCVMQAGKTVLVVCEQRGQLAFKAKARMKTRMLEECLLDRSQRCRSVAGWIPNLCLRLSKCGRRFTLFSFGLPEWDMQMETTTDSRQQE